MTVKLEKNGILRVVPEHKADFWKSKGYKEVDNKKASAGNSTTNTELAELKAKADKVGMSYNHNIGVTKLTEALNKYLEENPDKKALLAE